MLPPSSTGGCPGPPQRTHSGPLPPRIGGPGPIPPSNGHAPALDDLTQWQFWWELHKDALLFPRYTPPMPWVSDRARRELVRLLHKALSATTQRDLTIACVLAMAKAGVDPAGTSVREECVRRLRDQDRAVAGAAALALGLSTASTIVDAELLAALAVDSADGRVAVGGQVAPTTRAHALHGLGLLACRSGDVATKHLVTTTCRSVLAERDRDDGDRRVAAVLALRQLTLRQADANHRAVLDDADVLLTTTFEAARAGVDPARVHCPNAAARLLGPADPRSGLWRERCLAALALPGTVAGGAHARVAASCVQALGRLATAYGTADDLLTAERCSAALLVAHRQHPQGLVRNLAAIALAEIGGARNLRRLLDEFATAAPQQRPWLALAIGVHHARRPAGARFADDAEAIERLRGELATRRPPHEHAASVVALGLAGAHAGIADVRAVWRDGRKEELAGYAILAGAMLGAFDAADTAALAGQTRRRPDLGRQLAWGIALTGGRAAARELVTTWRQRDHHSEWLAADARALGMVRAPGTLAPLLEILLDESAPTLTRAAAAGALGCWLDPRPIPWNAALADGVAWHEPVVSLFSRYGVLSLY